MPDLSHFELHSQIGSGYSIANLGDFNEALDRLAKFDVDHLPLNNELFDLTIERFFRNIKSCHPLTELDAYHELNSNASSGFGAKLQGIKRRNDFRMVPYLKNYLNIGSHDFVSCFISGSQKDEIRVDGKTPRLFMGFPPEHTFMCALILGDFNRQFQQNSFCKNRTPSAVGDPLQGGALAVYHHELSKRRFLYCTDTSAQDSSIPMEFILRVYNKIYNLYSLTSEENQQFMNIVNNSVFKVVVLGGYFFLVPCGLGSGDYLTVVINILWRYYLLLTSYSINHDVHQFEQNNTVIINGDDLIMSSNFSDISHNSLFAKIEWAGKAVSWDDMDFCSCRFTPSIMHDPAKVLAVLYKRKKVVSQLHPNAEMQRLGGLLRAHAGREVYNKILHKMCYLRDKYNLIVEFEQNFETYDEVYSNYNIPCNFY